ncbi:hypothetical protein E2562_001459 [Oryza meyeriana var. granulata]|uniref:DUF7734 domain-containing protein n=1 Tax=Oryza meyeriana var. granulata TaxID=110450 RepID=A0A6G1DEX5_9ORYZ|nr:hypothetical protein E2562_001459 [Oryza meyeriana var. granulata]
MASHAHRACATATLSPSPGPCLRLRRHHELPRPAHALQRPRAVGIAAPPRKNRRRGAVACGARRRVRHEEDEEYGHNEEMARLERYSEGARDQALLVKARVDEEVEVVLVFKGFSSRLSGRTAADPAMSVLPERAIIQSVDVVRGPFDPSNIEYLEKDLLWDDFQSRLH